MPERTSPLSVTVLPGRSAALASTWQLTALAGLNTMVSGLAEGHAETGRVECVVAALCPSFSSSGCDAEAGRFTRRELFRCSRAVPILPR